MKYFFVLGSNTDLSVAELNAILPLKNLKLLAADFLVAEMDGEFNAAALLKRAGGLIKTGRVTAEFKSGNDRNFQAEIEDLVKARRQASPSGKFNFGFSDYGKRTFDKKDLGRRLKGSLTRDGISSRFVISREKNLSSVVVTQNKLLTRGVEIILAGDGDNILLGFTEAVQPFKDLSLRDYGRPARDDLSGMLPPKLAEIMINLSQARISEAVLLDPFCGSGTILTEAMVLGYKNLFGSDKSPKAVDDTHKNLSWVKELYKISDASYKLFVKKAENLSKFIKADSIDAIVTEPYLGPQRGRLEFQSVITNLESLYGEALREFRKVLKPKGRIVMVWPLYYGERPITPPHEGFEIINMIPESLRTSEFVKKSSRNTIVYGRKGQKVFREVVVLDKI